MADVISVYGQGKMGLPLAQVMAQYSRVIGVDVNTALVDKLSKGENPMPDEPGLGGLIKRNRKAKSYEATTDFDYASKKANIHVIIVPTLIKDNAPDLSIVKEVAGRIAKGLKRGDIVITECTMPPGSTESLIPVLEKLGLKLGEFGLAHCPERTMTGTAVRDITNRYPKIIGASDKRAAAKVKSIYAKVNKKGVLVMPSIKSAELVKVFEGCYRDVNIALANELAYVCEREGANAREVFEAANSQPYCRIHKPGYVGGHCIPYYPWFVIDEKTELMRTARKVNEDVAGKLVEKASGMLRKRGIEISGAKVLVMGLTFRGGVYEFEHSPAIPVISKMKGVGAVVYAYDPLCKGTDYERFGVEEKTRFSGIDCIIVLTDHKEFSKIDWKKAGKGMSNRIIIDGRGVIDPEKAISAGFDYWGLGTA